MSDRRQSATIILLAFASIAGCATSTSAQAVGAEKSAREAFELFSAATSVAALAPDDVSRLVSGLVLSSSDPGFRIWSLSAADGSLEVSVATISPEALYAASFTPRRLYSRIPDPLLSWMLQRAQEVALRTLAADEFVITLPERSLEGRGASAGIRGRQVRQVRVSMAGEYFGTSTTNVWPHRAQ